jgi:hypothetical protein
VFEVIMSWDDSAFMGYVFKVSVLGGDSVKVHRD